MDLKGNFVELTDRETNDSGLGLSRFPLSQLPEVIRGLQADAARRQSRVDDRNRDWNGGELPSDQHGQFYDPRLLRVQHLVMNLENIAPSQ